MKKSIIISIVLVCVLAIGAILIVPKFAGASGVKANADTIYKGEKDGPIMEDDPSAEDAASMVEKEPDTTPLYEATKTVLITDGDGFKVVIDGEEIALTRDGSEDHDGISCDKYVSENKTSYVFDSDGELLHYRINDDEEVMDACSLYMEGILEAVSEDEAVGIAKEFLYSLFGEKFNKAVQTWLSFGDDGMYMIDFSEMVGGEKNIHGLGYYTMILPNGKVFSAGTQCSTLLKDIKACDLDRFTDEFFEYAAHERLTELYGNDLISF
ncbi:MAG: hypothetical protein IKI91_08490, partial [Clostridia bacterium]|nr:hypothetical protein [Clostridia bacterium]